MSPTLVDFRTQKTITSSEMVAKNSSSFQNPNPKETMNWSSLGNGTSSIPNTNKTGSFESFDHSVASPSVSRSGFDKPVMSHHHQFSGLSKPRLVKVRKHFVPNQGRSSIPVSGKHVDSGFNDFVKSSGISNGSKEGEVNDQGIGWNPFASNTAQKSKSSNKSSDPVFAESDLHAYFRAFGISNGSRVQELDKQWNCWNPFAPNSAEMSKDSTSSNTNLNLGTNGVGETITIGKPLPDEMRKLNIGGERGKMENLNSSKVFEKPIFVFGSSSKKKSGLEENTASKLPDEMRKLNIERSVNGEGVEKANGANPSSNKVNDKNVPVFGSSNNVPNASCQTPGFTFPDEIRKLNIQGCVNASGFVKTKDSGFSSKTSGHSKTVPNPFGENTGFKLPDELNKLNIVDNDPAGGVEKTKDPYSSSKANEKKNAFIFGMSDNVPNAFAQSTEFNLPNEIKKLNVEDCGTASGFVKTKHAGLSTKASENKTFVFGCTENLSDSTGASSETTLPNGMNKLNMQDSRHDDGLEKTKDANFQCQTNKNDAGSIDGSTTNILPDGMKKLNIGSGINGSDGCSDTGFSSSQFKETQSGSSDEKIFHEPAGCNSIPTSFTFQAGLHGTRSGVSSVPHSDSKPNGAYVFSSSSSVAGPSFQSNSNPFEVPSRDRTEKKAEFIFPNSQDGLDTPLFRATKQDGSYPTTGNLDAGLNRKVEFSAKKAAKSSRLKKKGKLKQPGSVHQSLGEDYVSKANSSQEHPGSPGPYSPMDVSPYQETLAADQFIREASVASDELLYFDTKCASTNAHPSVFVDVTNENPADPIREELNEDRTGYEFKRGDGVKCPIEEFISGVEAECLRSKSEKVDTDGDVIIDTIKTEPNISSNIERQVSDDRIQFGFVSSSGNASGTNFTFAASTSAQGDLSPPKRHCRRKHRRKVGQDAESSILDAKIHFAFPSVPFFPVSGNASQSVPGKHDNEDSSISNSKEKNRSVADKEPEVKESSMTRSAAIAAAQEACEKWRLRGNQAYAQGNLSKAEVYYTHGVNCIPSKEASQSCLNALVLCYSNRAAARMSLGRMREALGDCKKAESIDPKFFKVQVRAANCHLALGEIDDALRYFKKCLQSRDLCLDRKIVIEASDGLQKAQKIAEYIDRCAELLQQRKFNDAESALRIIAEALLISPLSERLVEMKAEFLFMLRRYEEVVQLCEQALSTAEKSVPSMNAGGQIKNLDGSESIKNSRTRVWCLCLISKSYFHLGRLEEALDFLQKLEQVGPVTEMPESKNLKSLVSLSVTIRELLHHKTSGNEAFQSGKHTEAVEHYTAALSCNMESRPFAAICFCNRAAAHQALGQLSDAIADCSLAIALNGTYAKAISRRATLYEMIRDYGKAAIDVKKLISLLEKQKEDKTNHSGKLSRSGNVSDLRQARLRLFTLEEEAKKEVPLNMYLILGIEQSVEAADIKKAYRKAALRHHPDKAGQLLPRSENGDDGVWKEIVEEVHRDADRLFKMVGEAYAILSDSAKRSRYDYEEEFRSMQKKSNGSNTSRSPEFRSHPFERSSSSRRQWQEAWRSYHNSQWSESRSSRYY